jgi:hypothetical protein
MENKDRRRLIELLEKDEEGWMPLGTGTDVAKKVDLWIKGYFNTKEEYKGFQVREQKFGEEEQNFLNILELRNLQKNKGYAFFIGQKNSGEINHRITRMLCERVIKREGKYTEKYFLDLKQNLSGLYWETNYTLEKLKQA